MQLRSFKRERNPATPAADINNQDQNSSKSTHIRTGTIKASPPDAFTSAEELPYLHTCAVVSKRPASTLASGGVPRSLMSFNSGTRPSRSCTPQVAAQLLFRCHPYHVMSAV